MFVVKKLRALLFLGACMLFPALGQAQQQQQMAAAPGWNYETTMLPETSPGMTSEQVQQRCLKLFGNKVRYEGKNSGSPSALKLDFQAKNVMLGGVSYVTNRPLCVVTYAWENEQYGGQKNLSYYFDGKTIFEIDLQRSKVPRTDTIMTPNDDGSNLVMERRYQHTGPRLHYQKGVYVRK